MLKNKKIRQFSMVLLLPVLFMAFVFINPKSSYASITDNGEGNYTVTDGSDLWNLLSDSDNWWTGKWPYILNPKHTPPQTLNINVTREISLPSSTLPLYSGLTNVNVNFNNKTVYVKNQTESTIDISNAKNNQHLTVSNVSIDGSNAYGLYPNKVSILPPWLFGDTYYTSNKGILFSSNSTNSYDNNPKITYNNINYNCPKNLEGHNQPFSLGTVPIEFTGNNTIISGINGQQLAQISNIKVTSGSTIINATSGASLTDSLIKPADNNPATIDISHGAKLGIDNSSNSAIFSRYHANSININNSGFFNIDNTPSNNLTTLIFGKGINTINFNNFGSANLKSYGAIFDNYNDQTPLLSKVNMDLASSSETLLSSTNNAPFSKSGNWDSGSLIKFHPNAKFVSYSGVKNGGLTNFGSDIDVNFIDSGTATNGYKTNQPPTNIDGWPNLSPISTKYNSPNILIKSSNLDDPSANGLTLTDKYLAFAPDNNIANSYEWNYSLDKLPKKTGFLSRTDGNPLTFSVIDSRSAYPNFSISASYKPDQDNQPFTMWFKKDENSKIKLEKDPQRILNGNDMDKNGSEYKKEFSNDQGLLIKANNAAKAGNFTGTVDWTLNNGIDNQ